MNAASIEKSERLGRVLKLLSQGGEYTTLDIIRQANVCAVNSIVSELRQNGFHIDCQRRGEKWFYRLHSRLESYTMQLCPGNPATGLLEKP